MQHQSSDFHSKGGKAGIKALLNLSPEERLANSLKGFENAKDKLTGYWWNNGSTCTRSNVCPGEGWVKGRLPYKHIDK